MSTFLNTYYLTLTVQEHFLKRPEILLAHHVIMDAMCTQEHRATCPVMMHGKVFRIKAFERDNYLLSEPRVANQDEEGNIEKQEYAINTNTGKFHLPDCASVKKVKPDNVKYWICTREALIEEGYSPCGACNP